MRHMKLILTISGHGVAPSLGDLLSVAEETAGDRGCVVNRVDGPVDPSATQPTGLHQPVAFVEAWLDGADDVEAASAPWLDLGVVGGYTIDEVVQRAIPRSHQPGPTPGVTNIFPVSRAAGVSPDEFADHWTRIHGPLALRVHYGMSGYVQNIVRGTFFTADVDVDGFSNLHFPSVDDSVTKMYIDEAGAAAIAADVATFVGTSTGYRCFEHVVRPVSAPEPS